MENQRIFEELLALLEQNSVTVRTEHLGGGGGGLCKLKEKQVFFVDTDAAATEMLAICARAVNETVDIEGVYIRPQVRQCLQEYQTEK